MLWFFLCFSNLLWFSWLPTFVCVVSFDVAIVAFLFLNTATVFFLLKMFWLFLSLWVSLNYVKIHWLKIIVFIISEDVLFLLFWPFSDYDWCFVIAFLQLSLIHLIINLDCHDNHVLKCHRLFFSCYVILDYLLQISIELFCKSSVLLT